MLHQKMILILLLLTVCIIPGCDKSVTNSEEPAQIVLTVQQSEKDDVTTSITWIDRSEVTLDQSHILDLTDIQPFFFQSELKSLSIIPASEVADQIESEEIEYYFYVNFDGGNKREIWNDEELFLLDAENLPGLVSAIPFFLYEDSPGDIGNVLFEISRTTAKDLQINDPMIVGFHTSSLDVNSALSMTGAELQIQPDAYDDKPELRFQVNSTFTPKNIVPVVICHSLKDEVNRQTDATALHTNQNGWSQPTLNFTDQADLTFEFMLLQLPDMNP